jgi:hypothetical protein
VEVKAAMDKCENSMQQTQRKIDFAFVLMDAEDFEGGVPKRKMIRQWFDVISNMYNSVSIVRPSAATTHTTVTLPPRGYGF